MNVRAVMWSAVFFGCGMSNAMGAEPEDIIKYRQGVMKAQGGYMAAMAQIVQGKVDYGSHMLEHARGLNALSAHVTELFPEGSDFGETRAKAKIWEEFEAFEQAAKKNADAIAELLKTVEANAAGEYGAAFSAVGKSCKGCHEDYREKKE